ncbi:hypothetical protein ACG7TL_006687 [Trametes sanguinea]
MSHLRRNKHNWQITSPSSPAQAGSPGSSSLASLPPIPEDAPGDTPTVPSQASPSMPPKTPVASPRAMSLVLSPGQASNTSQMSLDPPEGGEPPAQPLEPVAAPSDLYDVPSAILATWGLLINRRLKSLVCVLCEAVVIPSHVVSHIHNKHKVARIQVNKAALEEIVQQEDILTTYPDVPPPDQVEFEGIHCAWGYACPLCPAMFQRPKDVVAHCRQKHHEHASADDLEGGWMQRFSEMPQAKSWFRVIPRSAQLRSVSAGYLTAMRKELDARPSLPSSLLDHRHISPWHITTRWMQYIEGKDPARMRDLIEPPKEDDPLFSVIASVRRYLQEAYNLVPQTSEVCLQILNTDTMSEDYNHHPFGQHQLNDTLRAYMRLITQLLCLLLCAQPQLNLPQDVAQLVDTLRQALSLGVEEAKEAIHELLLGLWMREWPPSAGNLFPDPTLQFVIHTQVNRDGSLKKAEEVTSVFAKLVYDMRLTFLYECHRRLDSPEQPSLTVSARALRPSFTKGLESTFHTLKSLQHRASSITMSSQNEPNMVWKDKTGFTSLIYLGHEISLDMLRHCQAAMEEETVKLLKDTLLFGQPFHIDLAALKDDMGNRQAGYSLFTDRVNADALGPVDQLADHILATPDLHKRFVLYVQDGQVVWNGVALSEWLSAFTRLNLLCLIQAEMNCGAPGRTTELTAMPTANTPGGMLRALRIIGSHVVLMRTYHKMRAASGFGL